MAGTLDLNLEQALRRKIAALEGELAQAEVDRHASTQSFSRIEADFVTLDGRYKALEKDRDWKMGIIQTAMAQGVDVIGSFDGLPVAADAIAIVSVANTRAFDAELRLDQIRIEMIQLDEHIFVAALSQVERAKALATLTIPISEALAWGRV